jgi:hypothetical protein
MDSKLEESVIEEEVSLLGREEELVLTQPVRKRGSRKVKTEYFLNIFFLPSSVIH